MMKVTPESMTYLYVAALQRGWRDVARTRPMKLDSAVRWDNLLYGNDARGHMALDYDWRAG